MVLLSLMGNTLIPTLFWHQNNMFEIAFFLVGGLATQIAALSLWAGMLAGRLKMRLLISCSFSVLVCTSYIIGLQIPELPNPTLPRIVAIVVAATGTGAYIVTTLVFLAISAFTKTQISRSESQQADEQDNRLSIGFVLAKTTIVAVVVSLLTRILPFSEESSRSSELTIIALLSMQHTTLCMAILILSTWTILSTRRNGVYALTLFVLMPLLVVANLFLQQLYGKYAVDGEIVRLLINFTLGFLIFTNAFLAVLRWLGYRIRSR